MHRLRKGIECVEFLLSGFKNMHKTLVPMFFPILLYMILTSYYTNIYQKPSTKFNIRGHN